MTVSPRVTHNLVTPQLAALQLSPACATFISIKHNTVFAFVYNPFMTHPTSHNPCYSMFYYHYYDRHFVCIQIGIRQEEAEFWTSSQTML